MTAYRKLPNFLVTNLTFADHVALMGLEITGFTRANLDELWIESSRISDELSPSRQLSTDSRMHVSIYHRQLGVPGNLLMPFARKSIS